VIPLKKGIKAFTLREVSLSSPHCSAGLETNSHGLSHLYPLLAKLNTQLEALKQGSIKDKRDKSKRQATRESGKDDCSIAHRNFRKCGFKFVLDDPSSSFQAV
jgi:hypothetical protein